MLLITIGTDLILDWLDESNLVKILKLLWKGLWHMIGNIGRTIQNSFGVGKNPFSTLLSGGMRYAYYQWAQNKINSSLFIRRAHGSLIVKNILSTMKSQRPSPPHTKCWSVVQLLFRYGLKGRHKKYTWLLLLSVFRFGVVWSRHSLCQSTGDGEKLMQVKYALAFSKQLQLTRTHTLIKTHDYIYKCSASVIRDNQWHKALVLYKI